MLIARRRFLKTGLLFGASAALFSQTARSGFARTLGLDGSLSDQVLNDPLYGFTRETFEPYVGGYFEAPGARGQMVALQLIKVDPFTPKSETRIPTRSGESFSLLFSADGALPSSTSIHKIKHGALGEFSLFLTRRDGSRGEIFYEAVINHMK